MNIENAVLTKIDIDRDSLSKQDLYDIYHNGKQPGKNAKIVFIFESHLYLDKDNDVQLYFKFNFDFTRDKNKQVFDCLNIKSLHLDNSVYPSKSMYDRNNPFLKPRDYDKRPYDYINEWKFEEEHEQTSFIHDR